MEKIPLFSTVEVETSSFCNRKCPSCLRNSYPQRKKVTSWFENNKLSTDIIYRLIDELVSMHYKGDINLQHYNEPLFDDRIVDIAKRAKDKGIRSIKMCTNGDLLTEAKARELNGLFDSLTIALYDDPPIPTKNNIYKLVSKIRKKHRKNELRKLLPKTHICFVENHIPTHFSQALDAQGLAKQYQYNPCNQPIKRFIVNHKGEVLLCCDDLIGHFDLGNVKASSIEELWYSDRHQEIALNLQKENGRQKYSYCMLCPRP
jgi:radical SAM protein with 4Fe4S-binding SPASM domain